MTPTKEDEEDMDDDVNSNQGEDKEEMDDDVNPNQGKDGDVSPNQGEDGDVNPNQGEEGDVNPNQGEDEEDMDDDVNPNQRVDDQGEGNDQVTSSKPLATLKKHKAVREKADLAYRQSAERMQRKHSQQHKVRIFNVGESASLHIPRIDRAATDVQRLPCVIVQVVGKAQTMYRLRCASGVLARCYTAGDLEPFTSGYNISVDDWEDDPRISLREAARKQAPWNAFTGNKCNCRQGAGDSKRCHCKKMGIDCSSHCHRGEDCKNKQYDEGNQTMATTESQKGTLNRP